MPAPKEIQETQVAVVVAAAVAADPETHPAVAAPRV